MLPLSLNPVYAIVFGKWRLPVVLRARTALRAINHSLLSKEARQTATRGSHWSADGQEHRPNVRQTAIHKRSNVGTLLFLGGREFALQCSCQPQTDRETAIRSYRTGSSSRFERFTSLTANPGSVLNASHFDEEHTSMRLVSQGDLHYDGSISIDRALMVGAGLLMNERVDIYNIETGTPFVTYIAEAPYGSGMIDLNDAAARWAMPGDP